MPTLTERAQELIENYAMGHAGTAFVAGQLGGQFGADRLALTALTVKMINDLCDLYGIHDSGARATHIASAIARLTFKGTVIAHTLLNWIPMLGPGANSITTYNLTKKAGNQCISDIERNRMNLVTQLGLAVGRTALTFGGTEISHAIGHGADFITDDILIDVKTHSELIASFLDHHAEVEDGVKYFLSHTIQSVGSAVTNGQKPDMRSILENTFYTTVIAEVSGYRVKHGSNYIKNKEELLKLVKSTDLREKLPSMTLYFDALADRYQNAVNDHDVKKMVDDISIKVSESITYLRSSNKADVEQIIRAIEPWTKAPT